jgi:hypothetical protein
MSRKIVRIPIGKTESYKSMRQKINFILAQLKDDLNKLPIEKEYILDIDNCDITTQIYKDYIIEDETDGPIRLQLTFDYNLYDTNSKTKEDNKNIYEEE